MRSIEAYLNVFKGVAKLLATIAIAFVIASFAGVLAQT